MAAHDTRSRLAEPAPLAPALSRVLAPFRTFTRTEASGGILLFLATVAALVWANSPWGDSYVDFWRTELAIGVGGSSMSMDFAHWINNGLMAIFFFVVGLEIKREVLVGELATLRQALLPISAAVGGAVLPALVYVVMNGGSEDVRGWGVPMATDIAFALGVMALLGSRVPTALKVFLTALAIVDDIIAVLVIAVFYSSGIAWNYLLAGLVLLGLLGIANRLHVRKPLVYALVGIVVWVMFEESGVHATVAGVLLAMTIPARTRIDSAEFVRRSRSLINDFERCETPGRSILSNHEHQAALQELETMTENVQSPMQRLEHLLLPWTAFFIVPLFALANAGVAIDGGFVDDLSGSISVGIIVGLIVGKQVGITLMTWLMVRLGWTSLPEGVQMRHVYATSWLAGIGFTMSLFVADLAFLDEERLNAAKMGILTASIIAGTVGFALLRWLTRPVAGGPKPQNAE